MTAFERESDLRLAGIQAAGEYFGGDDGAVFEEVSRGLAADATAGWL